MLGFRYYGPIEGRIVEIDRSASRCGAADAGPRGAGTRGARPDPAPGARVAAWGTADCAFTRPVMMVILTGHLSPPAGPVEPGGFDFRRHAWFTELGAVGYTRTPVLRLLCGG